jgi:type IV secretory pathway TraG/TraD family ATPase VirD4
MDAFSIFNQTSTKLTFKINDPDTAEYISRAFGEQEYITPVKTMTASTRSMRDGYNFSEQQRIRRIILPSEISGLKPLRGFVWIGEHPVTKISFDIFNQANRFSLIPKPVPEIDSGHEELIEEETDELLS